MNFLIQSALIPVKDGYETVNVQIGEGRLQTISPPEQPLELLSNTTVIDGHDKLLLPGFVNGHTHSSQVWQRGLIGQLPLELWLANTNDSSPGQLDQFYWGAVSTAVDTLLSGGTCVVDHVHLLPGQELATMTQLVQGYRDVGIRAVIAPLVQDLNYATSLPAGQLLPQGAEPWSTQEILGFMEAIAQQFHDPEAGIHIGVGPTGFHRCSDALMVGCIELSDRYNLCRHSHLLETRSQKLLAQERYGATAVEHLQTLGLLDHRTSLAHSVWLEDGDIAILAATGATVVHNPVSNLRLGSGLAPILKCLQAGVNVSFGCDGAASNDAQYLLEAIKLGTILHTISDPDYHHWITPRDALGMAALGGAKGINLGDQIGSLVPGKVADLVLYDLNHPSMLPRTDPIQLLVLGRPTDVVDCAWVNGRQVVGDGQILGTNVEHLWQALRDRPPITHPSQFKLIHQFESHYRTLMDQF